MALETVSRGCTKRDQRILDHIGLAKAIAYRIHQMLPVQVELDDLFQAGILGLLDAAQKYDTKRRVDFVSYAKHRIRGAIIDSLRQLDRASRDLRRRWKQIESTRLELRGLLKRDPTEAEIAERLQMDLTKFRKIVLEVHSVGEISTCSQSPQDESPLEHEFEGRPESQPDIMFSVAEMGALLTTAVSHLRPRQQKVVRLYYAGHKTMKEIGLSLGVNESRVSQLHKSALLKIRMELEARGVHSQGAF